MTVYELVFEYLIKNSLDFMSAKRFIKYSYELNKCTKLVNRYDLTIFNYHTSIKSLLVNYHSDFNQIATQFDFYEPPWTNFSNQQLVKALHHLESILDIKFDDAVYFLNWRMLIFKDYCHLSIRYKNESLNSKEHCICFTIYDIDLTK